MEETANNSQKTREDQSVINDTTIDSKETVELEKDLLVSKNELAHNANRDHLWKPGQSGNPAGRPKLSKFSLRDDLIKSLIRIKRKDKDLYQKIIDSYWLDPKMRAFLFEQIDGKARQSLELAGSMENPVRVVTVGVMVNPPGESNPVKSEQGGKINDDNV